jgi:hypothetical protein
MRYIQLVDTQHEETFICKIAKNVKEATNFIELDFEYVTCDYDEGGKLFRKRDLSYLGSSSISVGSWSSMDSHPSGEISRKSTFFVIVVTFWGHSLLA